MPSKTTNLGSSVNKTVYCTVELLRSVISIIKQRNLNYFEVNCELT